MPELTEQLLRPFINLGRADVGLSAVDNTADVSKPVSAAVQAELDAIRDIIAGLGSVTADTTPDVFVFEDVTAASLATLYESNAITVTGINSVAVVTVSGGTYSKNGGAYTSSPGTVISGNTIRVRHTSSGVNSTATSTVLTVGGVSDTFTTTTLASGVGTPSAPVILTSLNQTVNENTPISLLIETDVETTIALRTGGAAALFEVLGSSVAGESFDFEAMPPQAIGSTVTVPLRASRADDPSIYTDFSVVFTVVDLGEDGADVTPNAFSFTDVSSATSSTVYESNTITVTGINASTAISITGGEYSTNGGAYTSVSGTVINGDNVKVRHTSSGFGSTAVNTVLTIGGVSDVFTTTTASGGSLLSGSEDDGTSVFNSTQGNANTFNTAGVTRTANAVTAPDGTTTAALFTEAVTGGPIQHGGLSVVGAVAGSKTRKLSIYAKSNGRRYLHMRTNLGGEVLFDLQTQTVVDSLLTGTQSALVTACEPAVNGFYKCTFQFFDTAASGELWYYIMSNRATISGTKENSNIAYIGDGTSGMYFWRPKLVVT